MSLPPPTSQEYYSPRIVALAMGVSESSLKRWCDQGRLISSKTAGGHRRVSRSEILRFIRDSNLEFANPEAIGLPNLELDKRANSEVLFRALTRPNPQAVRELLLARFIKGDSLATIFDDIVTPAFQIIGEKWQSGELDVYQERLACELTTDVLHEIRSLLPKPAAGSPIAIGGTLVGDNYSLPTSMIQLIFASLGWNATSLGTHLPIDSLLAATANHLPNVLWISISNISDTKSFVDSFNAMSNALSEQTALVIGGRGITANIRKQLTFTVACDNLNQLDSYVTNLNRYTNPLN